MIATGYQTRRDNVEAVRQLAERYGARLTVHGNGEFWEYAAEQGDGPLIQRWLAGGHDLGAHMHAVYDADRAAPHGWRDANAAQEADETFVRALWDDHVRYLRALLPTLALDQATPFNSLDSNFVTMMHDYGFRLVGGGRHEISEAWFGHPPWQPYRIGRTYLEEDLRSPVLMVQHSSQLGEADVHGPPGGAVFEDNTVAHLQVQFLEAHLTRMNAERTGQPDDRLWLFGFLTHDNKSDAAMRSQIEVFLQWLTVNFGGGRRSARGNEILRFATFGMVGDEYEAWEAAHPGISSFNVPTPTPIDPADATRITPAASRAAYPYAYWGMARALAASSTAVVDYVAPVATFEARGVSCHALAIGPRADATRRDSRWLCWKETDGPATIDVSGLVGGAMVRQWDARSGAPSTVPAATLSVGADPVIFESPSVPLPTP